MKIAYKLFVEYNPRLLNKASVATLLNAAIYYKRTNKRRFALWTQKSLAHLSQPYEKKTI